MIMIKVTENGTIRKLGYGLLFAFHNNYGYTLQWRRQECARQGA